MSLFPCRSVDTTGFQSRLRSEFNEVWRFVVNYAGWSVRWRFDRRLTFQTSAMSGATSRVEILQTSRMAATVKIQKRGLVFPGEMTRLSCLPPCRLSPARGRRASPLCTAVLEAAADMGERQAIGSEIRVSTITGVPSYLLVNL